SGVHKHQNSDPGEHIGGTSSAHEQHELINQYCDGKNIEHPANGQPGRSGIPALQKFSHASTLSVTVSTEMGAAKSGLILEFFHDVRSHLPGLGNLICLETDGATFRVAAATVPLADGSKIVRQGNWRPRVRSNRHFGPEGRNAHGDCVHGLRKKKIRNELVIP